MSTAFPKHRLGAFALATITLLVWTAAFASVSQARTYQPSNCSYQNVAKVFSPWGDQNPYELAPDGGFEGGGAGWTLSNGATLVQTNEDRFLNGAADHTAVLLPYGASATSPPICVDETTPSFRVMTRNIGEKGAKLHVTINYAIAGGTKVQQTDSPPADKGWAPSPPLQLQTDGEAERVARITFTSVERKAEYLVDDLYVDPFARH
jgi:hypothetical protein